MLLVFRKVNEFVKSISSIFLLEQFLFLMTDILEMFYPKKGGSSRVYVRIVTYILYVLGNFVLYDHFGGVPLS